MVFLTLEIGVSGLAGCAVALVLMIFQGLTANLSAEYKRNAVSHTQERVKLVSGEQVRNVFLNEEHVPLRGNLKFYFILSA